MRSASLNKKFRTLIQAVERQAEEQIAKPFSSDIRGCHDPNPDEPHLRTIRSHIADIRANVEHRKREIAIEFIEKYSLEELETVHSLWDLITQWRYARFNTVGHRCLKAVQDAVRRRFPRHPELLAKLKSHSSEPWMKKFRLAQSPARRRKGPSSWNPALQDARDAAVSYFIAFHPLCGVLKKTAKFYAREEIYDQLRAWLLDGEIPSGVRDELPKRVRMSLLFKRTELARATDAMKLEAFFQLLRKRITKRELEEFANKIYGPPSQLSPSRMAEILASHFAGIAVNEVQSALRDARNSALRASKS